MIIRDAIALVLLFAVLLVQGCAFLASSKEPTRLATPADLKDFSPMGEWIYEDKLVMGVAQLDEHGNGSYPWKDGYFVTSGWEDGIWKGTWHQPGNDREGGFEIRLVDDLSSGQGRWWFTRIGEDTSPSRPGGEFTLSRP